MWQLLPTTTRIVQKKQLIPLYFHFLRIVRIYKNYANFGRRLVNVKLTNVGWKIAANYHAIYAMVRKNMCKI